METMEAFPGVRKGAKTARLMVAILPMASLATAGTIRIYDGVTLPGESSPYEGTGSLWISSANPDWYQGGLNALIRVGYQSSGANVLRGLIRFGAINEIYSGVDLGFTADQITGARLIVTTDDDGFGGSGVCELRVLGDSDEEWAEYHTTWNVRRKDTNPVQNWADGYGTGVGTNFRLPDLGGK